MRSKDTIAISRAVHSPDTRRGVRFARERHINTDSLVGITTGLRLADHDLFNLAVLTKIFSSTKRLKELVLVSNRWVQADNINQVLLDNANTGEVLPTRGFNFTSLGFLLLRGSCLAVF